MSEADAPVIVPLPKSNRFKNLVGSKLGRLTVIAFAGSRQGNAQWRCLCECGKEKTVAGHAMSGGHTRSCGCLGAEISGNRFRTHGMRHTREYSIWANMRERCSNAKNGDYPNYGGRGIRVCAEWESFHVFLSDMGKCPRGMTLDRIENNGGYEKGNCRWATPMQQGANKRNNHRITWNGETHHLREWERRRGLRHGILHDRITLYGWTIERALTQPVRTLRKAVAA